MAVQCKTNVYFCRHSILLFNNQLLSNKMTLKNILLICCLFHNISVLLSYDLIININEKLFPFKHFWKSTGFCVGILYEVEFNLFDTDTDTEFFNVISPPDPKENVSEYLLSNEQRTHLALIGSLPNKGIQYVRIHWLLNLLTSKRNGKNELVYNFTKMDMAMNVLHQSGLYPGFEIMGCNSKFVDFEKNRGFWSTLVEQIASRYLEQFGSIVSNWRFETWNEPDLATYNCLNFTKSEYLDYVLGCDEGLKSSFSPLNLAYDIGGPAGLFRDKNHRLCWGLLEFCSSASVDLCPLKYISFHRKGGGTSRGVLNGSLEAIERIFQKFPRLRTYPVSNDEADIETNWSLSLEWRGDVRYAFMVSKVIADYYKSVDRERKLKIELLGNDNGFLNYHPFYFTQRTLFARFQMNTTAPPYNQFIKKPVYSLMALLSFLGESWILTPTPASPDPLLTTIATRSVEQHKQAFVSVVLAYGNETDDDVLQEKSRNISLKIDGFDGRDWKFVVYQLDNIKTNPFKVWKEMGSPVFPDKQQRRRMREVEGPKKLFGPTKVHNSTLLLNLTLNIPSIHLIQVCSKIENFPKKVTSVAFYNVTWNEVLITWKYPYNDSKCLQKFEVELKPSKCNGTRSTESGTSSSHRRFERINSLDAIFMSFHQVGKDFEEPTGYNAINRTFKTST